MANKKQAWWDAIDADLPESISTLLEKTIDFTDLEVPEGVDAAIIEQGVLAAKLNKLLDDLQGLSLVELALRIGQRSTTAKLMLFTGVEALPEEPDDQGFVVLQPEEGAEYPPGEVEIQVKVNDDEIQSISVAVDDGDSQTLTREDDFKGSLLPTPGDRKATFTSDTELTKSVSFYSIEFMLEIYPADGSTVPGPVFDVSVKSIAGELKESVITLVFSGQPITQLQLIRAGQEFIWSNLVDFVPIVKDIPVGLLVGAPPGVMDFPLELWVEGVMQVEDTIIPIEKAVSNFALNLGMTVGEFLLEHVPGFGEEGTGEGEEEPEGGEGEGA